VHCTAGFWDLGEEQIGEGQTGETRSRKTYKGWNSPGKRQWQWPSTEKSDVSVWPNASNIDAV